MDDFYIKKLKKISHRNNTKKIKLSTHKRQMLLEQLYRRQKEKIYEEDTVVYNFKPNKFHLIKILGMRFLYFKVAIEQCMNPMEVEIQLVHPTKRSSDFMIFVSRTMEKPNQMSAQYVFQCCNFKLYTLDNK